MKSTDFRLGNLVLNGSTLSHVVLIEPEDLIIKNYSSHETTHKLSIHGIQPIKLTEEWLLNFGFDKRITENHSVQYFIGENPITRDWLFDILWLKEYSYPFYRNGFFKIRYVNQLQNLYFALTGEELELKTEVNFPQNAK